jgi:hypothetical protein
VARWPVRVPLSVIGNSLGDGSRRIECHADRETRTSSAPFLVTTPMPQILLATVLLLLPLAARAADGPAGVQLQKGDRVVVIGNTLAERMQHVGHWETLLHARFPELELVVRNLGWSADEITLRPRSKNFVDHHKG